MRTRLLPSMLAGDQGDRTAGAGRASRASSSTIASFAAPSTGGALTRTSSAPSRIATDARDGTRAAWPGPSSSTPPGNLPERVCYGAPAFFGARNETLSSTRTGASTSGGATASSSLR